MDGSNDKKKTAKPVGTGLREVAMFIGTGDDGVPALQNFKCLRVGGWRSLC